MGVIQLWQKVRRGAARLHVAFSFGDHTTDLRVPDSQMLVVSPTRQPRPSRVHPSRLRISNCTVPRQGLTTPLPSFLSEPCHLEL